MGRKFPPVLARLAHNAALRGEVDTALDYLRRAVELGYADYVWLVSDPSWGAVADTPEYQQLISGMQQEVARQRAHIESVHDEQAFRDEIARLIEQSAQASE